MINDIIPNAQAVLSREDKAIGEKALSPALSAILYAALCENGPLKRELISDILPFVCTKDRILLEDIMAADDSLRVIEDKRPARRELRGGCLSPNGNISGLICALKRYATPQGRMMLHQMEKALDTARIIGALSSDPSPEELLRFMGMGDAANMMSMLPKIMSMFNANE